MTESKPHIGAADIRWLSDRARREDPSSTYEDAAQDALLSALVSGPAPDPNRPSGLRPWLRTVLRNAVRQRRRSEVRRRARESAAATHHVTTDPETAAIANQQLRRLQDALTRLPPADRNLIEQRYHQERSPSEIAASLDVDATVIRARLSRALRRLRGELGLTHAKRGRASRVTASIAWAFETPTRWLWWMKTNSKIGIVVACVAVTAALRQATRSPADDPPSAVPPATAAATVKQPAVPSSSRWANEQKRLDWHQRLQRIRKVRADRAGSHAPAQTPIARRPPPSRLARAAFVEAYPMLAECVRDSVADTGRLLVRLRVLGEPDIGVVVDEVELMDDTVGDSALTDCVVESAPAFELGSSDSSIAGELLLEVDVDARTIESRTPETISDWSERNPRATAQELEQLAAMAQRDPDALMVRYRVKLGDNAETDIFRLRHARLGQPIEAVSP